MGRLVGQTAEKGWDFQVVIGLSRLRFWMLGRLSRRARLMRRLRRIGHVVLRLGALAATKQAPAAAAVVTVVVTLVGLRLLGRRRGALIEIALRRDARGRRAGLIFLDPRIDDGVQSARLRLGDADHRLGARFRFASGRSLKGRHDRRRLDAGLRRARGFCANRLTVGVAGRFRGARGIRDTAE